MERRILGDAEGKPQQGRGVLVGTEGGGAAAEQPAGAGGAGPSSLDPFPDRAAVPGWAEAPLAWAVEQELIKGTRVDGRLYLQPTGQATRAQFVTIMQRYLSTATKEETQ